MAVGPIVHDLSAQAAPRVALTGAIVDDGDIRIDGYPLAFDYAERDGHTYSDKAPGQEVLAIPAYAAARAVGADEAVIERAEGNLTLWWVTFWSAGVPAVAIIALAAVATHRRGIPIPFAGLATLAFGTMLLPFSANLYGHVLGAALGYAAWVVADGGPGTWRRGVAIGALLGLGVTVEYPVAIVAVAVLGLLVVRRRWAEAGAACLTGIPFALGLALYQWAAFGSPFSSGYTDKPYHEGSSAFITGVPDPATLLEALFGSRGLLLFTPIVAVGLYGIVVRWRESRDDGAAVAMAVVVGFLLLQAGWVNPWGGDGPGPRYVTPMLPFLALGIAAVWGRLSEFLRMVVVAVSLLSMGLATVTDHLVGDGGMLIGAHLGHLSDDGVNPTVWSIALGPIGWVVYGASVAAVLWLLVRPDPAPTPTETEPDRMAAITP